jgi:hypothetical protein
MNETVTEAIGVTGGHAGDHPQVLKCDERVTCHTSTYRGFPCLGDKLPEYSKSEAQGTT